MSVDFESVGRIAPNNGRNATTEFGQRPLRRKGIGGAGGR